MVQGAAEILESGPEHDEAQAALRRALSAARRDAHRRSAGGRGAHRPRQQLGAARGGLSPCPRRTLAVRRVSATVALVVAGGSCSERGGSDQACRGGDRARIGRTITSWRRPAHAEELAGKAPALAASAAHRQDRDAGAPVRASRSRCRCGPGAASRRPCDGRMPRCSRPACSGASIMVAGILEEARDDGDLWPLLLVLGLCALVSGALASMWLFRVREGNARGVDERPRARRDARGSNISRRSWRGWRTGAPTRRSGS